MTAIYVIGSYVLGLLNVVAVFAWIILFFLKKPPAYYPWKWGQQQISSQHLEASEEKQEPPESNS